MTGGHRHSQYCQKISGIPGNAWFPQMTVTYTLQLIIFPARYGDKKYLPPLSPWIIDKYMSETKAFQKHCSRAVLCFALDWKTCTQSDVGFNKEIWFNRSIIYLRCLPSVFLYLSLAYWYRIMSILVLLAVLQGRVNQHMYKVTSYINISYANKRAIRV